MGPLDPALVRTIDRQGTIQVGSLQVTAFPKPHDCAEPVGFVVAADGTRLGIATDLGEVGGEILMALTGCHALIFESNHDPDLERTAGRPAVLVNRVLGKYGHLSNRQAGEALAQLVTAETSIVMLAHLSIDCNTPPLAAGTVGPYLRRSGFRGRLCVAPADGPSSTMTACPFLVAPRLHDTTSIRLQSPATRVEPASDAPPCRGPRR